MSLDVSLVTEKYVSFDKGKTWSVEQHCFFTDNITHNLTNMANEAGLYEVLWRPYMLTEGYGDISNHNEDYLYERSVEIKASFLIPYLEDGLALLKKKPNVFKKHNPDNGWGTYEGLVRFTEAYLDACKTYPDAMVEVDR